MLAIVALMVPLATSVADRVGGEVRSQARAQADLVAATVADLLGPQGRQERDRVVETIARNSRGRVIVVDSRGRLLTDSAGGSRGQDYGGRPEIAAALRGRADQRERDSQTLGEPLLATSVPVLRNGRPAGAVRITQSMDAVDEAVRRAWIGLALIGLIVLGLGLVAGALIAAQITRPLSRLDRAVARVAQGDLTSRARIEGSAEQRSLGKTFNLMTQRLERLVGSQQAFVADASHQLRTPLTGIRLRLEAVQASELDAQAAGDLEAALAELDRMAETISELLELSRAGERDAAGERLSIADVAQRAAERWRAAAHERGLELAASVADGSEVWMARADADRILDVLVENAINYSGTGGGIAITAERGRIEVHDRGAGISASESEELFERFRRGRAARSGPGGSGLGLPIARELAQRWGARVSLRPRDGGGTIAELEFGGP